MFGVGIPEIMVIMVIALIIIGPDKLPDIARTLGKTMAEFKKVVDGVKGSIEEEQEKVEKSVDMPAYTMNLDEKHDALKDDYKEAFEGKSTKKATKSRKKGAKKTTAEDNKGAKKEA